MGLALLYVLTSGQLGVVMAAIPQVGLMLVTAALVFYFALAETGGWQGFARLAASHGDFVRLSGHHEPGVPGGVYVWGMILTLMTYPIVNQTVAQRILGAATEADGRKGTIACLVPWCLITGASILVGMMALRLVPEVQSGSADAVFPILMKRYLPPGVLGLGVAALTVASMSTAAGIGTAIAGLFTVDIFRMIDDPQCSDRWRLLATRGFAAAAIVCGTMFAMFIERYGGMIPFYVAFTGTFFLPLTVPYLGGAWLNWVSRGAGSASVAGGIGAGTALFLARDQIPVYLGHDQWRPFWVWAAAWVALIVWSLVENWLRGPIADADVASVLNVHGLGRPGTPEEIPSRVTGIPPPARPRPDNLDRKACGTPSHTPWYQHPTTFEAVALLLLIVLMIWWW
jgi:uncharacterized sodium:solute symporter family permease YidK